MPDKDFLMSLGFTEQRAQFVAEIFRSCQLQSNHVDILDFVHSFIQALFKYDLLLTDELSSLPDLNNKTKQIYIAKGYANGEEKITIQCCNFEESSNLENEIQHFFLANSSETKTDKMYQKMSYWYHGTDSASGSDIVEEGIDLTRGAYKKDFSDGSGFYLSDEYSKAYDWGRKRACIGNYYAILRYKIPAKVLAQGKVMSPDNEEDMIQWKEIVRYNRSGKRYGKGKIKPLLQQCSFLQGPLSNDGRWDKNRENYDWPKPLENSWSQLCIRDENLADKLNMYLDRVAFIKQNTCRSVQKYRRTT